MRFEKIAGKEPSFRQHKQWTPLSGSVLLHPIHYFLSDQGGWYLRGLIGTSFGNFFPAGLAYTIVGFPPIYWIFTSTLSKGTPSPFSFKHRFRAGRCGLIFQISPGND